MRKSSSPPTPPGENRPPRNPGLHQVIEGKRRWHYTPDAEARALGFRGWHERGYLPHFDAPNVTQLVTFNLADSFPVKRRAEWEPLLREPDESERRRQLEAWLDRGHGECWLRQPAVAGTGGRRAAGRAWSELPIAGMGHHAEPRPPGRGRLANTVNPAGEDVEGGHRARGECSAGPDRSVLAAGLLGYVHCG